MQVDPHKVQVMHYGSTQSDAAGLVYVCGGWMGGCMIQCVGRGRLRAGTNVSVWGVSVPSEPCLSGPEPGRPGSVTYPLKRETYKKRVENVKKTYGENVEKTTLENVEKTLKSKT